MTNTLVEALDQLHDQYVSAVNQAVAAGDDAGAMELAQAYEDDAIVLMAEREGLTHLLPITRRAPASRLRSPVSRLRHRFAA